MKITIDINTTERCIELRRMAREANTDVPHIVQAIVGLYFTQPIRTAAPARSYPAATWSSREVKLAEELLAAVKRYQAKVGGTELAKRFDITTPPSSRRGLGRPSLLSLENQQYALTLRAQGLTHKAIADQLGVKRPVIMRLCHKHGVTN